MADDNTEWVGKDIGEVHDLGDEKHKRPVADLKLFAAGLERDVMRFLMSIILSGPSAQAEFYNWMSDRWNALSQAERDDAALRGEQRWFTVEAWERYYMAGGDPSAPEKDSSTVKLIRVT